MSEKAIRRCLSCDGYGWVNDDFTGESVYCDWCAGVGYVYHHAGVDTPIPEADWDAVHDQLEALEQERLREIGFSGDARKPWEQDIRRGTQGGENPYERD